MIPVGQFEAVLDATPEKGVVVVEYWWQPPSSKRAAGRQAPGEMVVGDKTSIIYFKRILAGEKCWCGSGRAFARCHRRRDDWTYVALDPDRAEYSPVVLLERTFLDLIAGRLRQSLSRIESLLCIEWRNEHAAWALPAAPPLINEFGQLVLGSVNVDRRGVWIETNSEKRLEYLTAQLSQLLGIELGSCKTRRAEPQKAFTIPARRR